VFCLGGSRARAQSPAPAERSVWDTTYTQAQAARGQTVFRTVCSSCHTPAQFAGPSFLAAWDGGTAYELFQTLRSAMPQDNPGGLPREQYLEVIAYLFQLNGFPAGARELPADSAELRHIRIDAKPGGPPK
jgi:mono/diheme cytochrome c family protein